MTTTELQVLRESRLEGESLNETKDRLTKEGKFIPDKKSNLPATVPMNDEEGFFQDDLAIPRWRVIQPTSRIEGAKIGTFRNTLTGEEREKLENVIFLRRQNGRILFPKDDFSGERICWSYDGFFPAREEIIAKTGSDPKSDCCVKKACGQKIVCCPLAMWNNENKANGNGNGNRAPLCKETITFLGVDKNFLPLWLYFHGTAIPLVKNLISSIYLQKKQSAVQGQNIHLRDFRVTLGLKLQINDKGKFYVPVFEKVEKIADQEEQKLLTKCFDTLQKKELVETLELEGDHLQA